MPLSPPTRFMSFDIVQSKIKAVGRGRNLFPQSSAFHDGSNARSQNHLLNSIYHNGLDELTSEWTIRQEYAEFTQRQQTDGISPHHIRPVTAFSGGLDSGEKNEPGSSSVTKPLFLRRATATDRQRLWKWANDPVVRASAFNSSPISWKDHVDWFEKKRVDPDCLLFIATRAGRRPIGQIRFDLSRRKTARIDVSVDSKFRGRGYGSALIRKATERVMKKLRLKSVHAYVRLENAASVHTFERAGFETIGLKRVRGIRAIHYRLLAV